MAEPKNYYFNLFHRDVTPVVKANSDHATMEDKRRGMERLSFFSQDALPAAVMEPERAKLHELIDTLPIEQIREMLELCKRPTGKPDTLQAGEYPLAGSFEKLHEVNP